MWNLLMVNVARKEEFLPVQFAMMYYVHYKNHQREISFQCLHIVVRDWTNECDIEKSSEFLEEILESFYFWESTANSSYWKDCDVEVSDNDCISIYNTIKQTNGG